MKAENEVTTHDFTDDELNASFGPIGQFVTAHTQLDILVGKVIASFIGLGGHRFADHLLHSVESGRKKMMLDSIATIFKSDPLGIIGGYQPNPHLHGRIKSLALQFETLTKQRNILCHGTYGKLSGRLLLGSVAAERLFRNDGSRDSFVYVDEIPEHFRTLMQALKAAEALRQDFAEAHHRTGGGGGSA